MKKNMRILFALVALFGIMNCLVVEPALASDQATTCASNDSCDDCFICCALNHQIIPHTAIQLGPLHTASRWLVSNITFPLDSPTFSIFHPPLAA